MWIKLRHSKKEDAFISVEVLTSLTFLIILIFFSMQMIERQKKIIIRANLNVEATEVLFEIRKALRGNSCSENFSGLESTTDAGIIESIKMEARDGEDWPMIFPADQTIEGSRSGLKVSSYSLNPMGANQRKRDGVSYLKVNFSDSNNEEIFQKEVKIFIKSRNSKISECSLNPFSDSHYFWKGNGSFLSSMMDHFQINTKKSFGTLNLSGGMIVTPTVLGCSRFQLGTIFWSGSSKQWMRCSREGFIPLDDARVFSELGLKKMGEKR